MTSYSSKVNRENPQIHDEEDDDDEGGKGGARRYFQAHESVQEGHARFGDILNPAIDPDLQGPPQKQSNLATHPLLAESAQFSANREDPNNAPANENPEAIAMLDNNERSELEMSLKKRQELQHRQELKQRLTASNTMRPSPL